MKIIPIFEELLNEAPRRVDLTSSNSRDNKIFDVIVNGTHEHYDSYYDEMTTAVSDEALTWLYSKLSIEGKKVFSDWSNTREGQKVLSHNSQLNRHMYDHWKTRKPKPHIPYNRSDLNKKAN